MPDFLTHRSLDRTDLKQTILDIALDMGERVGWDGVHMHELAHAAGLTVAELDRHYKLKDALTEAWFERADAALLACADRPDWMQLTAAQRLKRSLLAWLDVLAQHRQLTASMLRYKLHPEHLHLQALGIMRISRTVQAWRECARLPSVGWRREVEEAALTTIYLTTLTAWLNDDSLGAARTRQLLDGLLSVAEYAALKTVPRNHLRR